MLNFSFYDTADSDLALERHRVSTDTPGVELRRERSPGGLWERIKITSAAGADAIGRPVGCYDTLTLPSMHTLDFEMQDDAQNEIAKELCRICELSSIIPDRILVVGLGNPDLTPDAVGPETAARVEPTMQLRRADEAAFLALECSEIAVIAPGVSSKSGIESADIIKGVCRRISPSLVIAIDALASRSPSRLGTTIQISDSGIHPGTGLGGRGASLNKDTLGVPVIAIGVPTVINSKYFTDGDGETSSAETLFVSPKDIGEIIKSAAKIIGGGINQAFGIYY
ncbi:MAG: GPR endopeptidase [Clostridia bacterium]|nr:GPR endopeptidase [Clostridia bacterium]